MHSVLARYAKQESPRRIDILVVLVEGWRTDIWWRQRWTPGSIRCRFESDWHRMWDRTSFRGGACSGRRQRLSNIGGNNAQLHFDRCIGSWIFARHNGAHRRAMGVGGTSESAAVCNWWSRPFATAVGLVVPFGRLEQRYWRTNSVMCIFRLGQYDCRRYADWQMAYLRYIDERSARATRGRPRADSSDSIFTGWKLGRDWLTRQSCLHVSSRRWP